MAKRRSELAGERNGAAVATEEPLLPHDPASEDPGYETPAERKAEESVPAAPLCTAFVSIMMPAAIGPEGEHKTDHLELRLFGKQVEALHRLWKGCERENVYLASGGRVVNRADVVRYLLERAADQMEV